MLFLHSKLPHLKLTLWKIHYGVVDMLSWILEDTREKGKENADTRKNLTGHSAA